MIKNDDLVFTYCPVCKYNNLNNSYKLGKEPCDGCVRRIRAFLGKEPEEIGDFSKTDKEITAVRYKYFRKCAKCGHMEKTETEWGIHTKVDWFCNKRKQRYYNMFYSDLTGEFIKDCKDVL